MKLNVIARLDGIYEHKFVVNVGSGKQSFKWLGQVASQKLGCFTHVHSDLRHREKSLAPLGEYSPYLIHSDSSNTKTDERDDNDNLHEIENNDFDLTLKKYNLYDAGNSLAGSTNVSMRQNLDHIHKGSGQLPPHFTDTEIEIGKMRKQGMKDFYFDDEKEDGEVEMKTSFEDDEYYSNISIEQENVGKTNNLIDKEEINTDSSVAEDKQDQEGQNLTETSSSSLSYPFLGSKFPFSGKSFYHPDSIVSKECYDGESIIVEFSSTINTNQLGNPIRSAYNTLAFQKSDLPHTRKTRNQVNYRLKKNINLLQEMKLEQEEKFHREELIRKSRTMRQLLGLSDASSNAVLVNNFNMVWSALQGNGILELYLNHNDFHLNEIKKMFEPHFLHLYEIYQSFAESKDCSMNFKDVMNMFNILGFTFVYKYRDLSVQLYLESLLINKDNFSFYQSPTKRNSKSENQPEESIRDAAAEYDKNDSDTLSTSKEVPSYAYNNIEIPRHITVDDCPTSFTFPNFLIMFIHLCVTKYVDFHVASRIPNMSINEIRKKRHILTKLANSSSIPKCVQMGIKEFIDPYINTNLVNVLIKELCNRDDVVGLYGLYHFHHGLGDLFNKFCANKPRTYKNGGFIQYPQFKNLLQLTKILVDYKPIVTKKVNLQIQQANSEKNNNAKIDISKRSAGGGNSVMDRNKMVEQGIKEEESKDPLHNGAFKAFNASRNVSTSLGEGDRFAVGKIEEDLTAVQLSYPECLEAFARVALMKFQNNERLSDLEKITSILEDITSVTY